MSERKEALNVTFEARAQGKCGWCGKETTVYDVVFSDKSFVGAYCQKDIFRAVDNKTAERRPTQQTIPLATAAK